MTRVIESVGADYFERLFRDDPDPWGFASEPYEQAKYDHTIRALGGRHYQRALEIGCANGVLTERLSYVSRSLCAVDGSDTALSLARARCAHLPNVRFERSVFPSDFRTTLSFDLIVLSEVAYYWNDVDLSLEADVMTSVGEIGCDIILVHWIGETNYPQTGDGAVDKLRSLLGNHVEIIRNEREASYRLDLWRLR
jgi:SAM-dependent methyltransferase